LKIPGATDIPTSGTVVDALWISAPFAAYLLEIEKVIGGVIAGIIALLALGAAIYRFIYWRARAKREQEAWNYERPLMHRRVDDDHT